MIEDDRITSPVIGSVLVSYALGELDAEEQSALEKRLEQTPALLEELAEIRLHLRLHEEVRKVAPRRGSFERLHARMKREGAFAGAVPGAHCMLRRSFVAAMVFGLIAVVLLAVFTRHRGAIAPPEQIGQIDYHNPSRAYGERRAVEASEYLLLLDDRDALNVRGQYNTGERDAFIWLTGGQPRQYSSLELSQKTEFRFTAPRRMELDAGTIRRLDARPATIAEGPFVIVTPHAVVQVDEGRLAVSVTPDQVQTQVSVIEGSARVQGRSSDNIIFQVTAGNCTSVERNKLPAQPRPMLELLLTEHPHNKYELQASLRNVGFVPVKVTRAGSSKPLYMLHISYPSAYDPGDGPVNTTVPPQAVTPKPEPGEAPDAHHGDIWLAPGGAGQRYQFTFDVSPFLVAAAAPRYWLRLEYRADMYAPPGEARVKVDSPNVLIVEKKD